jgi:hypothetical protein
MNVIFADFGKDLDLRPEIFAAIHRSAHPAAITFEVWVTEVLYAIDPFGFRGPAGTGTYRYPKPRSELNAMIRAAVDAVLPVQLQLNLEDE